jgi:serine/threonine protein phosphatase 1
MITLGLAPGASPQGERLYVIGDVHGCLDLLQALHAKIAADLAARPVTRATLVHIGDYVDRGADSAGVIDLLLRGPAVPNAAVVNLMGNHEQMMLDAIDHADQRTARVWLDNGGAASLRSWGISSTRPAEWAPALPPAHLGFLRALARSHRAGDFVFVHAGIRPGLPLKRQDPHDLLWIREPFLSSQDDFGFVVVHGHTPGPEPVVRFNRIGIDTGAVMGGVLTCVVLEGDRIGFLRAGLAE